MTLPQEDTKPAYGFLFYINGETEKSIEADSLAEALRENPEFHEDQLIEVMDLVSMNVLWHPEWSDGPWMDEAITA